MFTVAERIEGKKECRNLWGSWDKTDLSRCLRWTPHHTTKRMWKYFGWAWFENINSFTEREETSDRRVYSLDIFQSGKLRD